MPFQILKPDDLQWQDSFDRLPLHQRDIFYCPSFARLCQATLNRNDEVCCAVLSLDANVILYPFVRRNVGQLTDTQSFSKLYDITSMYGRGGIVASRFADDEYASFHAALAEYCSETAVICGFDRYHPVMGNHVWAAPAAGVMDVGGFVVVDMRPEMNEIEKSFKTSVHKDLKKAERNGITCFAESDSAHLAEFLKIYRHTLERNSAANFYYFSDDYFSALARELGGQFHYFYAVSGGAIVSCELVLHCGKYSHSFLGGTVREALSLCANPLLKREIIRFLKDRGAEYFLLGGGTRPNDGIFQFKKAYAPAGVMPSRIGGTIWDHASYDGMKSYLSAAGSPLSNSRFQFYDVG
jgi:hypothetical protein